MVAVRPGLGMWILQPNTVGKSRSRTRSITEEHMVNSSGVKLYKIIWDKLLLCFSAPEVDGLAFYQLQDAFAFYQLNTNPTSPCGGVHSCFVESTCVGLDVEQWWQPMWAAPREPLAQAEVKVPLSPVPRVALGIPQLRREQKSIHSFFLAMSLWLLQLPACVSSHNHYEMLINLQG